VINEPQKTQKPRTAETTFFFLRFKNYSTVDVSHVQKPFTPLLRFCGSAVSCSYNKIKCIYAQKGVSAVPLTSAL
jgi:hypothetical protein